MSFYNINFEVKYNNINDELLDKIKLNAEANITSEYSEDDIFSICTNLYQHELSSVFYASSLLDDKIDDGIEKVYNVWLSKYDPFMQILDNSKMFLFTYDNETCNLSSLQKQNLENNSRYFLLLMLFSENMFYLTHECICQLIKNNSIELALLNEFEIELNKMLKSKF